MDEVGAGHTPDDLRELVDHSVTAGALDHEQRDRILTALDLDRAPLRELVRPRAEVSGVSVDDRVARIREVSRRSGHLRLVVGDAAGRPVGVVHVRDTLTRPPDTTAAALMRPAVVLAADTHLDDALTFMRGRNHLALVAEGEEILGLVTMQDLLDRLLPVTPSPR